MKRIMNNSGFTLIELLIVLSIFGIIIAIALNLMNYTFRSYKNSDAQWQIQQSARYAMDYIARDVRNSKSILSISKENKNGVDKSKLELDISENGLHTTEEFIWETNGNDKILHKIVFENDIETKREIIIRNIDDIIFSTVDDDGVTVNDYSNVKILNITLSTKLPGVDRIFSLTTDIYSRIDS